LSEEKGGRISIAGAILTAAFGIALSRAGNLTCSEGLTMKDYENPTTAKRITKTAEANHSRNQHIFHHTQSTRIYRLVIKLSNSCFAIQHLVLLY
jgi:hypothetical protein